MIVYALTYQDYDSASFGPVFKTKELAEAHCKQLGGYDVEEFEVLTEEPKRVEYYQVTAMSDINGNLSEFTYHKNWDYDYNLDLDSIDPNYQDWDFMTNNPYLVSLPKEIFCSAFALTRAAARDKIKAGLDEGLAKIKKQRQSKKRSDAYYKRKKNAK